MCSLRETYVVRLQPDLPYFGIAQKYSAGQIRIQSTIMAYVHTLHEIYFVGAVVELPTQEKNKCTMPNAF